MRIAILCSATGWGGLELNTARLAFNLTGEGWDVTLFVSDDSPLQKYVEQTHVSSAVVPSESGFNGKRRAARNLAHMLEANGISILLTPYNKDIALASRCKRRYFKDLRVIYQQHMQVGVAKRDPVHTSRYKALDAWISPLPYLKAETMQLTKVPEEKIRVIPFGIDPDRFMTGAITREGAREALALPQDALIIGCLGRIDPKKGQDFLIRAMQAWNTTYPASPAHLLIQGAPTPGEGDGFYNSLKALAAELKVADAVHFREHAKDIAGFFAAIDVFAMPAQGETYGMVTLEAMASGVPVIGTDKDGTRELLQAGKLGYLHRLNDTEHFCTQLRALLENADLAAMLQLAHDTVVRDYNEKKVFKETESLLKSLL